MTIRSRVVIGKSGERMFILACCFFVLNCNDGPQDDAIPVQPFESIQLNLSLPSNTALQSVGGYKAIGEGGTRGIILYRLNSTAVLAFERNCSYQPQSACATVDVHSSGIYMHDACCGSSFRFDTGDPSGGPAWRPLLQYATTLNGSTLVVTDQVIN